MSGTRRKVTTAVTGLVTAGLLLSGCGTTIAGTAISDTTTPPTTTAAPRTTTTAPRPTTTAPTDPFAERLVEIVRDVDATWESALHRTIDARMREVGSVGCDGTPTRLAAVCTPSGGGVPTLEWNRAGLSEVQREGTEVAVVLTLAHEYGHIVLGATGNSTNDPREERRADCLAGAYLSVAGPKYGSSSDVLWNEAFPATRPLGASDKAEDVRFAAINEGFKVPDNDPLGWCLANA
ncbi:ImmA/IrrE family metallo-endopeptidase [Mycobacteroides abscessus]|uniref:ImmA/IrrE family metallo-endopeptidase n=1 Tax=Mycobacteroides abscessus TaxID=36809 RepID=UPI000940AD3D|nr:hypothetical protein [Mycobacteroides abscessus]MDM2173431.1 hypothetical protein [Mycobacteroides abscessus]MDM2176298.1 hypothetical protein [Mycobacteroides abscessus]MDM2204863.1 hypothetical protein [Mycobacteroides abscessus]MDM2213851.1 hypothetical protein [Mycobacteroides abscessus]MDM2215782.1 hypothetical protein [Mycobacteroides abscessus]